MWTLIIPALADGIPPIKHGQRYKIQIEKPDGGKVSISKPIESADVIGVINLI